VSFIENKQGNKKSDKISKSSQKKEKNLLQKLINN
jgi:hypothetical protein